MVVVNGKRHDFFQLVVLKTTSKKGTACQSKLSSGNV